jgi:hypothetical protein
VRSLFYQDMCTHTSISIVWTAQTVKIVRKQYLMVLEKNRRQNQVKCGQTKEGE